MAYIGKVDILQAYKKLSEMNSEPNAQGATQRVSAIRHFLALDSYYKKYGINCNTRDSSAKKNFAELVGLVSDVCLDLYTTNFYYPLKHHSGDYCVGSNFYSAGQVYASLVNSTKIFDYPKRGGNPLFRIKNGLLIRDSNLYQNFKSYIISIEYAVALTVWLIRKINIDNDKDKTPYENLRDTLKTIFTEELLNVLISNAEDFEKELQNYSFKFNDNFYSIREGDIESLFKFTNKTDFIMSLDNPRQVIYFGAPGTGKSKTVKKITNNDNSIRTTFHPDTDYSTFVGAYKPTMEYLPCEVQHSNSVKENVVDVEHKYKRIVYSFEPQAFLRAYVKAWQWEHKRKPFYLIIEEINRGNCAQIFGDIFQLLDRDKNGESDYSITPDRDIEDFLAQDKKFGFNNEDSAFVPDEIKKGQRMRLPSNLFIYATMNTSDQSLFPIDSAFKRRWYWKYVPITDAGRGLVIEIGDSRYDWWQFVVEINKLIGKLTSSEDKKLGYWFANPAGGGQIINSELFTGKVLFYLWNDVFSDYDFDSPEFDDVDDSKLTFDKFYTTDSLGSVQIADDKVKLFLDHLHIDTLEATAEKNE